MRKKMKYMVFAFRTTADAIAMEKICNTHHIAGRLIPTPREISAGCGLAWRMTDADYEKWKEQLAKMKYDSVTALML